VAVSTGTAWGTSLTAATANTASALVQRDASGNFSAGTITASLTGTASTATTANALNTGNSYQVASLGVGTAANGVTGDITASRSGGTTGVIFFGTSGARYLYYDGTNYLMPSTNLYVNGGLTLTSSNYTSYVAQLTTAGGSAPSYSARAWVNFNGQGTVSIRSSGNVSSISDLGVGGYTVNFSTGMQDANYSVSGTCGVYGASYGAVTQVGTATGGVSIATMNWAGNANTDYAYVGVSVFR